jgi:hypothetical protein
MSASSATGRTAVMTTVASCAAIDCGRHCSRGWGWLAHDRSIVVVPD